MQVVSFYENVFEQQFARRFRSSVTCYKLSCELYPLKPSSLPKPRTRSSFLLRMLAEGSTEDFLLVEPDTLMTARPDILLEEKDFDVASYYDQATLSLSGPLFVRHSARARHLVQEWTELAAKFPERPENELLSELLSQDQGRWSTRRLPVTYAWVERVDRERYPAARPVITHFKAGSLSNRIRIPG